jgi:hypothetical protein
MSDAHGGRLAGVPPARGRPHYHKEVVGAPTVIVSWRTHYHEDAPTITITRTHPLSQGDTAPMSDANGGRLPPSATSTTATGVTQA